MLGPRGSESKKKGPPRGLSAALVARPYLGTHARLGVAGYVCARVGWSGVWGVSGRPGGAARAVVEMPVPRSTKKNSKVINS